MSPQEIRSSREHLGLTQREFARRVGYAFATVNRWERAKRMSPDDLPEVSGPGALRCPAPCDGAFDQS